MEFFIDKLENLDVTDREISDLLSEVYVQGGDNLFMMRVLVLSQLVGQIAERFARGVLGDVRDDLYAVHVVGFGE